MERIRELIKNVLSRSSSSNEVEELVLALASLLMPLVKSSLYPKIRQEGYQSYDIALIALSSLFSRNAAGEFPVLKEVFNGRDDLLAEGAEESLKKFVIAVLSRRLRETYSVLAREVWPERAKLRREIFLALKKYDAAPKNGLRNDGLVFFGGESSATSLPPLPYETLLEVAGSLRLQGIQVPKFVKKIATAFVEKKLTAPVRVRDILDVYEEINPRPDCLGGEAFQTPGGFMEEQNTRFPLLSWIEAADKMNRGILDRYEKKGKITPRERRAFLKTLREMIKDWTEGGKEGSILKYLKRHLQEIHPDFYRRERRKILEYLWRRSRKFMKDEVRQWQLSARRKFAAPESKERESV